MEKILVPAINEFVSEYVAKRLKAETAKLREEIAGLRVDHAVGRSILKGEIRHLQQLKGSA